MTANATTTQNDFFEVTLPEQEVSHAELPLEAMITEAEASIAAQMDAGKACATGYSSGKDSSVLASLVLNVARMRIEQDLPVPTLILSHGNTLIENPAVDLLAKAEMKRIKAYADRHGFGDKLIIDIATPNLSNHYFVQVLAGRTIATFPENGAKCSEMLKVAPLSKQKRRLRKQFGLDGMVTMIGTRLDESAARGRAMRDRGESAIEPVVNDQGEQILSPIMHWSTDHIFEYLGYVKAGLIESYSDFDDLLEVYRGANGGSCELSIMANGKAPSTACGARTGCTICLRVAPLRAGKDGGIAPQREESLNNMVKDEKYAYMAGLARYRDYLAACHYDPSKRSWLGRTVNEDDSTVAISPDAYSPDHCRDLIAMALTLDVEEIEAAEQLGIAPRFTLLRPEDVVGIDYIAARYGRTRGLMACELWKRVYVEGERFPVPENPVPHAKEALPPPVRVKIVDAEYNSVFSGLRDLEAAVADCEELIEKKDGRVYSGGPGGDEFTVDAEGAELFLNWELDYALERFAQDYVAPMAVCHYFLRMGTVELHRGGHAENDRMMRLGSLIDRLGLREIIDDRDALLAKLGGHIPLVEADTDEEQLALAL